MAIATDRDRQIETTLELMRIILDRLNRADTEMIEKGSTDELISELEWGARVLEVEDVVRCYMAGGLNPRQEQELLDLRGYAMLDGGDQALQARLFQAATPRRAGESRLPQREATATGT